MLILVVRAAPSSCGGVSSRARPRNLALPVLTIGLTALPLLYYAVLGHIDLSWELARDASKHAFPLLAILLAIAPLLLPALLAATAAPRELPRRRDADRGRWRRS